MINNRVYIFTFLIGLGIGRGASHLSPSLLLAGVTPFLLVMGCVYLWISWKTWGVRGVAGYLALGCFALVIEYIGTTSCFPYGCFEYTSVLGPHLGPIPLLLVCIRPVLVLSMSGVASVESSRTFSRGVLSVLCLLVLDLALDPVHVAQGIWTYSNPTGRYSVPWSNYLGRVFTGTISLCLFFMLTQPTKNTYPLAFIVGGIGMLGYFWGLFGGMVV